MLGDLGTAAESARPDATPRTRTAGRRAAAERGLRGVPAPSRRTALRLEPGGLPDDAFEHDGQLTKRDLRASALARLAPLPGELLWDVGAGAGSVAIEWARTDPRCRGDRHRAGPDPGRADRPQRRPGSAYPGLQVVTADGPRHSTGCRRRTRSSSAAERDAGVLEPAGSLLPPADGWSCTPSRWRPRDAARGLAPARRRADPARRSSRRSRSGRFRGWTPARPIVQWSMIERARSDGDGALRRRRARARPTC